MFITVEMNVTSLFYSNQSTSISFFISFYIYHDFGNTHLRYAYNTRVLKELRIEWYKIGLVLEL